MDESFDTTTFLLPLSFWIITSKEGDTVGGADSGIDSIAIFTDKDLAERFVARQNTADFVPHCIPKENASAFFEELKRKGIPLVSIDPSGVLESKPQTLLVDDIVHANRRIV